MRKKRFLEITLISVLIWLGCIIFSNIGYEEVDDTTMNMIAAGLFGEPSQYLVYMGILLGYFLKFLYMLFPYVNCYLWIFLVFNLISVIAFLLVITDKASYLQTAILSILFNILLAKDLYINIQFTKNGIVYSAVGLVILAWLIARDRRSWGYIVVAGLLLAMGASTRKESFLFVLPFGAVAILAELLKDKKRFKNILAVMVVPVVMVGAVVATNFVAFDMNKEWREFYEWDDILMQIRDFGNYNFYWDEEGYRAAGFTEWDFRLLDDWMYADTEVFSIERIRLIPEIGKDTRVSDLRLDWKLVVESIDHTKLTLAESFLPYALFAILILAVVICIIKKQYLYLAATVAYGLISFGEMYYLMNVRRPLWRAEFGVWFTPIIFVTFLITLLPAVLSEKKTFVKIASAAAGVASLAALFIWQSTNLDYSQRSYEKVLESDLYQYELFDAISKSEGFYIVSVLIPDDLCGVKNLFEIDRRYADWFHNSMYDGGWTFPAPIGLYSAHEYGITNPFKELIERDDVYYIGDGERMGYLFQFLDEKYGPGLSVNNVGEICGKMVWQFSKSE